MGRRGVAVLGSLVGLVSALALAAPAGASSGREGQSTTLKPTAELKGRGVGSNSEFGYVTAISGNTIAVGSPYFDNAGRVFIFERKGSHWRQTQVLRGSNTKGGDVFGVDVKISGSEMIVGADQASGTGRAYIFDEVHGVWRQAVELPVSGLTPGDHYGLSVAISGPNAIVSTENDNEAFIYHKTGSTWAQSADLTGQGEFGFWVGISGSTAVVGADEYGQLLDSGAMYVYTLTGVTWKQSAMLVGSGVQAFDHFGQNIAISGNTIVVNAPYHNHSQGRVYVFTKTSTGWKQATYVIGSGAKAPDTFGWYVAIDGDTFAAGMPEWENSGTGSAYVFRGSGSSWKQIAILKGTALAGGDQYGCSVGISGDTVVVGAYGSSTGGQAYVFHL